MRIVKTIQNCEYCNFSSDKPAMYRRHLRTRRHINLSQGLTNRKTYFCPNINCPYQTQSWSNMDRHKVSHTRRAEKPLMAKLETVGRMLKMYEMPDFDVPEGENKEEQMRQLKDQLRGARIALETFRELGWEGLLPLEEKRLEAYMLHGE